MENSKKNIIVCLLFLCNLIISCRNNSTSEINKIAHSDDSISIKHHQDTLKCKNDPSLYTEIITDLLYKDSNSQIYLKRKQNNLKSPLGGELSECQKLPYAFIKEIGTLNDSIAFIKDVVAINFFKRIDNTDIYFTDDTNLFVYRDYPVGYPPFYQIDINLKQVQIIDSLYIKDRFNVYWKGIKINKADSKSFTSKVVKDRNSVPFSLVYDKNRLYFFDKPYTLERLGGLPLNTHTLDSLRNIFFK